MRNRMGRRIAWAVISALGVAGGILFACVGHDVSPPDDGGSDVYSAIDVDAGDGDGDAEAGRTCSASMPFASVHALNSINTTDYEEYAPTLTADEKTIVFARGNNPAAQLYIATRASLDDDFGEPQLISELVNFSGARDNRDPQISASGDDMVFNSSPSGYVTFQIFRAHREDGGTFGTPTLLLADSGPNTSRPFLTSDGSELFFSSTRNSDAGQFQIYRSSLNSDGVANDPVPVPELDVSGENGYPVLSQDGLTMYFASTRPCPTTARYQLRPYVTSRPTRDDPFDAGPLPVDPFGGSPTPASTCVSTAMTTAYPGWLSTDGCRLYFDTDMYGLADIYVAYK